jgi:hypothetical protein
MLEKKVFHPVKHSPIKPISSKMFLKKKLDSKGALVKWKARLVAGGHLQSPDDTVIRSSPTVHRNSFMCRHWKLEIQGQFIASILFCSKG